MKHLKHGGAQHFEGTFLRKMGIFLDEKGASLFIAKS